MQCIGQRKGYTKIQLGVGEGEKEKNHGEPPQSIEAPWHGWLEPRFKKNKRGAYKLGGGKKNRGVWAASF